MACPWSTAHGPWDRRPTSMRVADSTPGAAELGSTIADPPRRAALPVGDGDMLMTWRLDRTGRSLPSPTG